MRFYQHKYGDLPADGDFTIPRILMKNLWKWWWKTQKHLDLINTNSDLVNKNGILEVSEVAGKPQVIQVGARPWETAIAQALDLGMSEDPGFNALLSLSTTDDQVPVHDHSGMYMTHYMYLTGMIVLYVHITLQ